MTAAYRLRGLGWFLSGVIVVLGFYLVSLQVAAERKKVADIERKIRIAQRDIRGLETEFDTRANFAQLERWNNDVFGLTVPASAQFVADEGALASIDVQGGGAVPGRGGAVQVASYVMPAGPVADQVQASVPVPSAKPSTQPPAMAATPGRTVLASVAVVAPHGASAPSSRPAPRTLARSAAPRLALLDRKLLSESTLGDLVAGANAEARGDR